jgi:hypothetical protein
MAAVTINIPNIGNVVAENAASEETALKILAAIQKAGGATGGGQMAGTKPGSKEEKDLKKAREEEGKQIKKNTEDSKKQGKEQDNTNKTSSAFGNYLKGAWGGMKEGFSMGKTAIGNFGKTLLATAAAVATSFATSYEQMAKDPIGAAATMMATNIDIVGMTAKAGVDVLNAGVHAVAGFLGPFSGAVTGASDALSAAAKAAIDFATTVLKVANQVFAQEFKKSAAMLHDFTKAGASFAGGMTEMRNTAHASGLMMDQFSAIVKAAGSDIRNMGLNQADGMMAVAHGMSTLKNQIGTSGKSVRDELLAMGYTYEEQGEIVAQYGAQMKASGKDIRNIAPAELATQVKDYAKNLKVISDITGQDAKKLMDKARQESMRGSLMAKLTNEQKEAFKGAHSTMAAMGPEFQNALMQMLAGGTVTDPMIAGNKEAMDMIQKVASEVQSGNKNIVSETTSAMSEAAEATRRRTAVEGSATDTAVLLGNNMGGVVKGFADVTNKMSGFTMAADAAERSADAADRQSTAHDALTTGYQDLTKQMNDFGQEMEKFATDNLPAYANLLTENAKQTMGLMAEAIGIIREGVGNYAKRKAEEEGVDVDKTTSLLATGAGAYVGAELGATIGTFIAPGIGTAIGAGLGGIAGGLAGFFGEKMAKHAEGGIATPGMLNIFGEAGPEAAVPLPDGKSIPVKLNTQGLMSADMATLMSGNFDSAIRSMTDFQTQNNDEQQKAFADTIKELGTKLDMLGAKIESQSSSGGGIMSELTSHMAELKDTALKQLDAHEIMKRTLADSKDNLNGILNNII